MSARLTPEQIRRLRADAPHFAPDNDIPVQMLCDMALALLAESAALQAKASEIPGLTAALDEARWERDVAKGEKTAGSQALAEIERLVAELADVRARFEEKLREPIPVLKLESSPVDQFLRDYANNLRQRADSLDKEERFATADTRRDMASFVSRLRQALATGRPFRETELYQEPR